MAIINQYLKDMAASVREWVEHEDMKRDQQSYRMNGFCAIASAEFSRRLTSEGIDHEIHMSEDDIGCHVFVVIDDYIYDVTATQFPEYINTKVLIMHTREAEINWYHCTHRTFRNAAQLRKFQTRAGWPKYQVAYAD